MNIESKLGQLFDFQKFECNEKLDSIIKDSIEKGAMYIPDDDLEYVAAGRNVTVDSKKKDL